MIKKAIKAAILVLVGAGNAYAQTWERMNINFPPGDTAFSEPVFVTRNIGWLGGYKMKLPFVTDIFKTTDGGLHWEFQLKINSRGGTIFALDTLHCWISDTNLYITTDGGATWDTSKMPRCQKWYFFNIDEGIALSEYRPWFTSDGGRTWSSGDSGNVYLYSNDIEFVDRYRGWIGGYSHFAYDAGSIAMTTDGGKTWHYQDSVMSKVYNIEFIDSLIGFAVGTNSFLDHGFIFSTVDGGKEWTTKYFLGTGPFYDVGFFNDTIGWVVGEGIILRTTDRGETWTTQVEGLPSELSKLTILKEDKVAYFFGGTYSEEPPFTWLIADLSNLTRIIAPKSLPYLWQNYPNPFNPSTTIDYQLQAKSFVKLAIYDILGKEIDVLVNREMDSGFQTVTWDATGFSSGIYIARLIAENSAVSIKLILIK